MLTQADGATATGRPAGTAVMQAPGNPLVACLQHTLSHNQLQLCDWRRCRRSGHDSPHQCTPSPRTSCRTPAAPRAGKLPETQQGSTGLSSPRGEVARGCEGRGTAPAAGCFGAAARRPRPAHLILGRAPAAPWDASCPRRGSPGAGWAGRGEAPTPRGRRRRRPGGGTGRGPSPSHPRAPAREADGHEEARAHASIAAGVAATRASMRRGSRRGTLVDRAGTGRGHTDLGGPLAVVRHGEAAAALLRNPGHGCGLPHGGQGGGGWCNLLGVQNSTQS